MKHLCAVLLFVIVLIGTPGLISCPTTTSARGVVQSDEDATSRRGGLLILLLTSTGWDQERFTVSAGTYELRVDNASGGQYTVKGRRIRPDGERKTLVNEQMRIGGRVEAEVRLRAGDKFVVRIGERKEWKAIVNVTAN